MRIREILLTIPGITNRFIYYLEQQGYIQPEKQPQGKRDLRNYSLEDYGVIERTWHYHRIDKLPPKVAYEKALKKEITYFYLIGRIDARSLQNEINEFRDIHEIKTLFTLYEDKDLLLELRAPEDDIIHVDSIIRRSLHFIPKTGNITTYKVKKTVWSDLSERRNEYMLAWVLIRIPAKHSGGVVEKLKKLKKDGIKGAWTLYGEMDVLVRIEVESKNALDDLIMNKIQGITEVEYTITYLTVDSLPNMYWEK